VPSIVQAANRLIQHNTRLPGAPVMLPPNMSEDSMILFHEENTQEQEAQWVAEQILQLEIKLRDTNKTKYGEEVPQFSEIAILARNRYLFEPVRAELEKRSIPCHFQTANEGLFAALQTRILHLILRVWHNPFDLLHREVLLTELGIVDRDFENFSEQLNGETATTFFGSLADKRPCSSCWRNFIQALLDKVRKDDDLLNNFSALFEAFEKHVLPCVDDAKHDELLQRDLQFLKSKFQSFTHRHPAEERTLEGFLCELALSGRSDSAGTGVQLLTLHAAKGLEFEGVILIGMNAGSLPDYRSIKTLNGLEEERRNAYVAITRAKKFLCLTRCRNRLMPWGDNKKQEPSQFLKEMGLTNT
ncbi:MAG: ATP-dependent helicase, partial [candidate division KSB1 bacterium]